jgi:hypothetical protein
MHTHGGFSKKTRLRYGLIYQRSYATATPKAALAAVLDELRRQFKDDHRAGDSEEDVADAG